jgi:methylenetetrahydrofolate dehydrogenase (NADP+)/methenyltetrahydrofolate cyclohydrolase
METKLLDGKKVQGEIFKQLESKVKALGKRNVFPVLAVVLAGDDPASQVYVANKEKACQRLGIRSVVHRLPADVTQLALEALVKNLNEDNEVHGILVQLPLPAGLDEGKIIELINPAKDVDGFHPLNVGRSYLGLDTFAPCTPAGVMELLRRQEIAVAGKHCVIVGRSNVVGKPLAFLMLKENATVTVCHSKTEQLEKYTRLADIVVAAVGRPGMLIKEMLKAGVVVVDVGINRTSEGKLVGDVDFDAMLGYASAITPVPGGVGPMTIAMLMVNVVRAAERK